jgi:hypothetical protein
MVIGMTTGTDITIMMTIVRIRMIMITTTTISDGGHGTLKKTAASAAVFLLFSQRYYLRLARSDDISLVRR